MKFCTHSDSERLKTGVDVDERGITVCRACALPVWASDVGMKLAAATPEADSSRQQRARRERVVMTTLQEVPGCTIGEILGLVSGVGHPAGPVFTTTAFRGAEAHLAALDDLRTTAHDMGADAVVGITLGVYTGGNRSMQQAIGVHLLGTAVRLRVDEPTPG